MPKCPHNRRKAQCYECKGSQICLHNRIKSQCKECGGKYICEHYRRKSIFTNVFNTIMKTN